jgi:16S rRNA (cytosine1402-N4)-methyltransferase
MVGDASSTRYASLKKVLIRASEAEVKANPRSRSAWLRVAERLEQKGA